MVRLLPAALALLAWAAPLEAAPRPMTPRDMLDLPALSHPRLSPDGRQILFVRQTSDWEAGRRVSHLWRIARSGGEAVQLTRGGGGVEDPAWSPDGSAIAFAAEREGDRADQLYLLPSDGGEARRLTELPRGVGSFRWSPDGRSIYLLTTDAPPALPDGHIRAAGESGGHRHLWRVDLAGGEPARLTQGDFSVRDFSLSEDGAAIVHVRQPGREVDDRHRGEIWLMDAGGGNARRLTDNDHEEDNPALSPDGRWIAFEAQVNAAGEAYYGNNLFLLPVDGGAPRLLTQGIGHEVVAFRWKDPGALFLLANMGVRDELFELSAASGALRQLTDAAHTLRDWQYDRRNGVHLFLRRTAADPGDVWTMPSAGGAGMRRVTREYADLAELFLLPRQEAVRWTGADGVAVEGLITYPVGYRSGDRVPLVLLNHGGPRSSVQYGPWIWSQYQPVLAGRGYAVLAPNYRGSTGYGDAFLRGQVGGFFGVAEQDVLRGVDAMVAAGIADPDRLLVMGWSAGGRMTNKLLTLTDRFRAASTGASTVDFISGYGTTDAHYLQTFWFGAAPWAEGARLDHYLAQSPLPDLWRVSTPTLIFAGERDERVRPEQSQMLYRALRAHGVDTELYIAPREGHNFRELGHRLFKIETELAWFERHLRERGDGARAEPPDPAP